jgi:hypothetical protein
VHQRNFAYSRKYFAQSRKTFFLHFLPFVLAVAAVTVLTSVGPAAAGTGYGQLIVDPGTAAPGRTVSILGVCPTNGSVLTGVHSTAFVGGSASITVGSENFTGTATISPSAAPGSYVVMAACGPGSPSADIVVSGGVAMPTTAPGTTRPPQSKPAVPPPAHTSPPPMSTATGGSESTGNTGNTGGSAISPGGMTSRPATASPATPSPSFPAASSTAGAATSPAPAVTSTGVIRVGLAGHTSPIPGMLPPALVAAALALACVVGFITYRRRRNSSGSNE